MRTPVKGTSAAGRRREQRAWLTRRRIADAGLRLFLDKGYVATSVEAIAGEAGVAPATVYQAFGTKHSILAAALDATIAGDAEPKTVLDRDWVEQASSERAAERRLELVVEHTAEIAARTAPIKEVMRDAAAVEPALRELIAKDHANRRRTQEALVRIILGVTDGSDDRVRHAADTYYALVNSDTYRLMVIHLGWTYEQWRDWLQRLLRQHLFGARREQLR